MTLPTSRAVSAFATRTLTALPMIAVLALVNATAHAARPAAPSTIAALAPVAGDSLSLDGHVVYVDFWASWCVPCRSSFPWMASMRAKYHDRGLEVVTIDLDHESKAAHRFLEQMKSPLPVFEDPKGEMAKRFGIEVMPTSFVFGRDGTLRARHEGFRAGDSAALESQITALLEEKPPK